MQLKSILTIFLLALLSSNAIGQEDSVIEHFSTLSTNAQKIHYLCDAANRVVADQPALADKYLLLAESTISPEDSCYFKSMIRLGFVKVYRFQGKLDDALTEVNMALLNLGSCENERLKAEVLLAKGGICFRLGKNDDAVDALEEAEQLMQKLSLEKELSSVYNLLGGVQWARGNYPKAIETFLKTLRLKERHGDSIGIANVSNNIGIVYDDQKDYKKAILWYKKALGIYRGKEFNSGLRNVLNNLGVAYKNQGDLSKAYMVLEESLLMEKKAGNVSGIGYSSNNIGEVLYQQGNYANAAVYFNRALRALKECGDDGGLPACYINLGRVNVKLGNTANALDYLNLGLALALKSENVDMQKEANFCLYGIEKGKGEYKKALAHFEAFHFLSDSLNGVKAKKQLNELLVQYESEKKEAKIQSLEREKVFQATLIHKKRIELFISSISSLFLLLLAILLYYTYRQKKSAFQILALQNGEIQEQKEEIASQRDEISKTNIRLTDSIHYAKTIQNALLSNVDSIKEFFPSYIYFNLPKDIVSGDFIWTGVYQRKAVIAAVDCTGHGVPGAFMSMLAITYLNQIFAESEDLNPADFIAKMKQKVEESLHQKGRLDDSHDGLAISVALIDLDTLQLYFAAAGMKALVIRPTDSGVEAIRLKGNTTPIGYYSVGSDYRIERMILKPSDRFFMFSDGYADQFGDADGRRLLHKGFVKIVSESSTLPLEKQLEVIENHFYSWKGDREQIDDVMVFGLMV